MRWRHPLHVGDVRPVETVPTPGFPTPKSLVALEVTLRAVQPALRFPSHLKLPRSSPRACGVAVAVARLPAPHATVAYRSRPSHSSVRSRLTSSEDSVNGRNIEQM